MATTMSYNPPFAFENRLSGERAVGVDLQRFCLLDGGMISSISSLPNMRFRPHAD